MQLSYISVKTRIPLPLHEVAAGFDRRLFDYLKPRFPSLLIDRYDGEYTGGLIHLRLGVGPFYFRWQLRIAASWSEATAWGFEDEGLVLPPPFTAWRHQHRLHARSATETEIEDYVGYRTGPLWLSNWVRPLIRAQFAARSPLYKAYFCGTGKPGLVR